MFKQALSFWFQGNPDSVRLGLSGILVVIVMISSGGRFISKAPETPCLSCQAISSDQVSARTEIDFVLVMGAHLSK